MAWAGIRSLLRVALLPGLPIFVTVNDCVGGLTRIRGPSMAPALNEDGAGEIGLVEKLTVRWPWLRNLSRGDIVTLRRPEDPKGASDEDLPLAHVTVEWTHLVGQRLVLLLIAHDVMLQGHIWVEGDNAAVSQDSRSRFGPVPAALVQGRLVSVLWPPHAVGGADAACASNRLLVMNARAFQDGNDS